MLGGETSQSEVADRLGNCNGAASNPVRAPAATAPSPPTPPPASGGASAPGSTLYLAIAGGAVLLAAVVAVAACWCSSRRQRSHATEGNLNTATSYVNQAFRGAGPPRDGDLYEDFPGQRNSRDSGGTSATYQSTSRMETFTSGDDVYSDDGAGSGAPSYENSGAAAEAAAAGRAARTGGSGSHGDPYARIGAGQPGAPAPAGDYGRMRKGGGAGRYSVMEPASATRQPVPTYINTPASGQPPAVMYINMPAGNESSTDADLDLGAGAGGGTLYGPMAPAVAAAVPEGEPLPTPPPRQAPPAAARNSVAYMEPAAGQEERYMEQTYGQQLYAEPDIDAPLGTATAPEPAYDPATIPSSFTPYAEPTEEDPVLPTLPRVPAEGAEGGTGGMDDVDGYARVQYSLQLHAAAVLVGGTATRQEGATSTAC